MVDGRNLAKQLIGKLSDYLHDFIHPRWCRISSIHSIIYDEVCSKRQGEIPKFGACQDFMTTIDYMYMSFKVGESHHLGNLNVYIVGHLSKEQLSEFCQLS